MPNKSWDIALTEAKKLLIERATIGTKWTYTDFTTELNKKQVIQFRPHNDESFTQLLKEIAIESFEKYQHMLPAIVVGKTTGVPNGGFYSLAYSLGLEGDDFEIALDQINKVHTFYKNYEIKDYVDLLKAAGKEYHRVQEMNEPYVTVKEAAKHLGVSEASVYRWVENKDLPAYRIGRVWKFKISEINSWVYVRKVKK